MSGLLGGVGSDKGGCEDTSHEQRQSIVNRLEELADMGGLNRQTIDAAYRARSICSDEADYFYSRMNNGLS